MLDFDPIISMITLNINCLSTPNKGPVCKTGLNILKNFTCYLGPRDWLNLPATTSIHMYHLGTQGQAHLTCCRNLCTLCGDLEINLPHPSQAPSTYHQGAWGQAHLSTTDTTGARVPACLVSSHRQQSLTTDSTNNCSLSLGNSQTPLMLITAKEIMMRLHYGAYSELKPKRPTYSTL